ncbi:hypothetical protein MyNCGM70_35630 [Achromobacter xylosoxidans]|nr:Uncharacterised protein [Achromobacter xylosoxidans]CUJ76068.1 Uncharacterised protein [Achromobacter xylosoxidans]
MPVGVACVMTLPRRSAPPRALNVASTDTRSANSVISPPGATVRSARASMSAAAILTAPRPDALNRALSSKRLAPRSAGRAVSSSRPPAMAATHPSSTTRAAVF